MEFCEEYLLAAATNLLLTAKRGESLNDGTMFDIGPTKQNQITFWPDKVAEQAAWERLV